MYPRKVRMLGLPRVPIFEAGSRMRLNNFSLRKNLRKLNIFKVHKTDEEKWEAMFEVWEDVLSKKLPKIQKLCIRGIPKSVRGKAWFHLSHGKVLMKKNPSLYQILQLQEPKEEDQRTIEVDVPRIYDINPHFPRNQEALDELGRILRAFAVLHKANGYWQHHGVIAGFLLMFMPEEHAFWSLVAICTRYLYGYNFTSNRALIRDSMVFESLTQKIFPDVYNYMSAEIIHTQSLVSKWFSILYIRAVPLEAVTRIWDQFLCEGFGIIYRIGLVLLSDFRKHCKTKLRDACEFEDAFKEYTSTPGNINSDSLLRKARNLQITQEELMEEHFIQTRLYKIKYE